MTKQSVITFDKILCAVILPLKEHRTLTQDWRLFHEHVCVWISVDLASWVRRVNAGKMTVRYQKASDK